MSEPIRCERMLPTEYTAVMQAAHRNDSECPAPNHVALRGEDIVGAASVGPIMFIAGWADKQTVTETEARQLLEYCVEQARLTGAQLAIVGCTADCRFLPHMRAAGFAPGENVRLFIKRL